MKNDTNKMIKKFFARHWITVWLVAVSVLFTAILVTYAAYTDANRKIKRVVAPAAKTDNLFTSNFLSLGNSNVKSAFFEGTGPYNFDVIIRNYNPADPNNIFDENITYTLSVELAHKNGTAYTASEAAAMPGTANITVSINEDDSSLHETLMLDATHISDASAKTHTLTSSNKDDSWHVRFTGLELGSDYCVKITATPNYIGLEAISATINIAEYPKIHQEGWTCELADGDPLSVYDAYNYTITGTGAKQLKFSYDSSKLVVNPAFYTLDLSYEKDSVTVDQVVAPVDHATKSGWKTIVINADPDITKSNRYDFQVYKVGSYQPASLTEITPNETGSYIEFG